MKQILGPCIVAATLMMAPAAASADTITYELNFEFSGAQSPQGPQPWLTATFDDFDGTGLVQLTMNAANLVGTEFVSDWSFNLDPTMSLTNLNIAYVSGVQATTVVKSEDGLKADGDGYFDISFLWNNGLFGPGATTTSVYTFTLAGLTVDSFDFPSVNGGGPGNFYSAAHVQSIGTSGAGSGWIGDGDGPDEENQEPLPEPASMLLFGTGVAAFVARRRQRTA